MSLQLADRSIVYPYSILDGIVLALCVRIARNQGLHRGEGDEAPGQGEQHDQGCDDGYDSVHLGELRGPKAYMGVVIRETDPVIDRR